MNISPSANTHSISQHQHNWKSTDANWSCQGFKALGLDRRWDLCPIFQAKSIRHQPEAQSVSKLHLLKKSSNIHNTQMILMAPSLHFHFSSSFFFSSSSLSKQFAKSTMVTSTSLGSGTPHMNIRMNNLFQSCRTTPFKYRKKLEQQKDSKQKLFTALTLWSKQSSYCQ